RQRGPCDDRWMNRRHAAIALAAPIALGCRHETPLPVAEASPTVVIAAPLPDPPKPVPSAPVAEAPSAEAPRAQVDDTQAVYFNLDDAEVEAMMMALIHIVGESVAVDPDARGMVGCTKVTTSSPGKVKPSAVPGIVDRVLAPKGLSLRRRSGVLTLARLPGAR